MKRKLEELKRQLGARDWAEFFEKIARIYEEWRSMKIDEEVKQVLCNDYSESKATLVAWGKMLASRFKDPDKIVAALRYLKLDQDGEYVVDKALCA
jgi:UDP-glucose 4-epimerase